MFTAEDILKEYGGRGGMDWEGETGTEHDLVASQPGHLPFPALGQA